MSAKPYELRNGNCKELIKHIADNTIDAIVTDPPYELGFMGKKWDATGKAAILEGFRFLGFEMETQYIEIATARIEWAIEQKDKQKTEQENTLFGA